MMKEPAEIHGDHALPLWVSSLLKLVKKKSPKHIIPSLLYNGIPAGGIFNINPNPNPNPNPNFLLKCTGSLQTDSFRWPPSSSCSSPSPASCTNRKKNRIASQEASMASVSAASDSCDESKREPPPPPPRPRFHDAGGSVACCRSSEDGTEEYNTASSNYFVVESECGGDEEGEESRRQFLFFECSFSFRGSLDQETIAMEEAKEEGYGDETGGGGGGVEGGEAMANGDKIFSRFDLATGPHIRRDVQLPLEHLRDGEEDDDGEEEEEEEDDDDDDEDEEAIARIQSLALQDFSADRLISRHNPIINHIRISRGIARVEEGNQSAGKLIIRHIQMPSKASEEEEEELNRNVEAQEEEEEDEEEEVNPNLEEEEESEEVNPNLEGEDDDEEEELNPNLEAAAAAAEEEEVNPNLEEEEEVNPNLEEDEEEEESEELNPANLSAINICGYHLHPLPHLLHHQSETNDSVHTSPEEEADHSNPNPSAVRIHDQDEEEEENHGDGGDGDGDHHPPHHPPPHHHHLHHQSETNDSSVHTSPDTSPSKPPFPYQQSQALAMAKYSHDPCSDFVSSIIDMILAHGLTEREELEELFRCYLHLNAPQHHSTIAIAFLSAMLTLNILHL